MTSLFREARLEMLGGEKTALGEFMTLLDVRQNQLYKIKRVSGTGTVSRRLLDMGFTKGTEIFIAGVAPFGKTILVSYRQCLVALREDAAELIELEGKKPNLPACPHGKQSVKEAL